MKLRMASNVRGGVMASYIDPETRQAIKVKRLYFEKSVEVDDYEALLLRGQNKGKILTETEWDARFNPEAQKPNIEQFDEASLKQYLIDTSIESLCNQYSVKELREMAEQLGVKIPFTIKKKTLVAQAVKDIAAND